MGKTLTLSIIFQAGSLNFGEGTSNISELKKFHRGNGDIHTFASRQSIRYDIVRLGNEMFGWNLNTVDKSRGVIQFKDDVSIVDSVEMDLFGYLKTGSKSKKRSAVARLSHALSLEPYRGDMEFLNNMGLAARIDETANLANIEQHLSLYSYHISVDLDRVGIDGDIRLPNEERVNRVKQLLDIIKILNRDIRGRRENLAPLFVIGGVYPISNPFFMGRLKLESKSNEWILQTSPLLETLNTTWNGYAISENTVIGLTSGWLGNESELRGAFKNVLSVDQFFALISKEVEKAIGV